MKLVSGSFEPCDRFLPRFGKALLALGWAWASVVVFAVVTSVAGALVGATIAAVILVVLGVALLLVFVVLGAALLLVFMLVRAGIFVLVIRWAASSSVRLLSLASLVVGVVSSLLLVSPFFSVVGTATSSVLPLVLVATFRSTSLAWHLR
jgi:hypothetical protein